MGSHFRLNPIDIDEERTNEAIQRTSTLRFEAIVCNSIDSTDVIASGLCHWVWIVGKLSNLDDSQGSCITDDHRNELEEIDA